MRRLFWMGMGAAAAVSGERWLVRTWRQAGQRRIDASSGLPGPGPGGTVGLPGPGSGGTVGPAVDVVGALGVVVGRHAARIAGFGARRVGDRVRRAVEGGRADARAREDDLRHAVGLAEPRGQVSRPSGRQSGRASRAGEQPARRPHRDKL